MRPDLASIATQLSRFRYVLAIAGVVACVHTMAPEPDLTGSVACGDMLCGSGDLCIDVSIDGSGGSSDPIEENSCATPPLGCPLIACSGACPNNESTNEPCCPPCIVNLCGPIINYDGARTVSCYGF